MRTSASEAASALRRRRDGVYEAPPRRGRQPALRVHGHALDRPDGERGAEGVGERVLGARHVARAGREIGHELAVAFAGDPRRGRAGLRLAAAGRSEFAEASQVWRGAQFCLQYGHFNDLGAFF